MGIADIRNAFNAVTQPAFTATQVFHEYLHEHDAELQLLRFLGTSQDGKPFQCQSDKLRASADPVLEGANTARAFLAQQKATP